VEAYITLKVLARAFTRRDGNRAIVVATVEAIRVLRRETKGTLVTCGQRLLGKKAVLGIETKCFYEFDPVHFGFHVFGAQGHETGASLIKCTSLPQRFQPCLDEADAKIISFLPQ